MIDRATLWLPRTEARAPWRLRTWRYARRDRPRRIHNAWASSRSAPPPSADSADMLLQLAIGGAGILRISEHVVARSISEGLLQPLLQDAQDPESYPLFALMPPGHHQAPK